VSLSARYVGGADSLTGAGGTASPQGTMGVSITVPAAA
jgi:hypothetical protein